MPHTVPLPAKISAGCGLAFSADPNDETEIMEIMLKNGIEHNGVHLVELYQRWSKINWVLTKLCYKCKMGVKVFYLTGSKVAGTSWIMFCAIHCYSTFMAIY